MNVLKDNQTNLFYNLISETLYNPDDKSINFNTSLNGLKLLFGKTEKIIEKASKFLDFLKHYSSLNRSGFPKIIDLRWDNKVVVQDYYSDNN